MYVIEIPHTGRPECWSALDGEDFIDRVVAAHEQGNDGTTLYEALTPAEMLEEYGVSIEEAREDESLADVVALYDKFGPDTRLVCAYPSDEWVPVSDEDAPSRMDAIMAWLGRDRQRVIYLTSTDDALDALAGRGNYNPWDGHMGAEARDALVEQMTRDASYSTELQQAMMERLAELPELIGVLEAAGVRIPARFRPLFLIHSEQEDGYWSNEQGWVEDVGSASVYDQPLGSLPVEVLDACWIAFKPIGEQT